jgi:hypothetical protein
MKKLNFDDEQNIILQKIEEKVRDLIDYAHNGEKEFKEIFGYSITNQYDQMINECIDSDDFSSESCEILKVTDEVAYRTGLSEFLDSTCSDLSYELLNLKKQSSSNFDGLISELISIFKDADSCDDFSEIEDLENRLLNI